MSGLGELDRPGAPVSSGPWDERSEEWLASDLAHDPHPDPALDLCKAADAAHPALAPASASAGDNSPGAASPRPESSCAEPPRPAPPDSAARPRRGGVPAGGVPVGGPSRRGAADPVKALMHRHRDLCERAVDPLEIAAGLEAHGVTDRTAARFRHRDVFSLAEEMYARVPRGGDPPPRPTTAPAPRARLDRALLTLLPGVLCAAAVVALPLTHGRARFLTAAAGVLAVALALRAVLRRGPLAAPGRTPHPTAPGTGGWTCWLLAYAALGDGLLRAAVDGGPDGLPTGTADGAWPLAPAALLTLGLAVAPAAGCAHLLSVRARRALHGSRGLDEFAASVRPLLLGTVALFLGAVAALTGLCAAALDEPAAYAQTITLGALLLLARLLTVHGHSRAPALALRLSGAAVALGPATVLAGRLPGCGLLAEPVDRLVTAWGPGALPALACGAAALALLVHATRALTRASAHARTGPPY
ncbi:hypothetical protein ACIPPJ_16045 [Streptomyces sp. NPDC086091]|uniref:hypothetical protein n=1 Tax=Streptomyces sp. NPDC086091 TaxID=3365751 RepID=UPI00381223C4